MLLIYALLCIKYFFDNNYTQIILAGNHLSAKVILAGAYCMISEGEPSFLTKGLPSIRAINKSDRLPSMAMSTPSCHIDLHRLLLASINYLSR